MLERVDESSNSELPWMRIVNSRLNVKKRTTEAIGAVAIQTAQILTTSSERRRVGEGTDCKRQGMIKEKRIVSTRC